jgi:hypothetical protein
MVREVAAVTRCWRRFASDCGLTQRQLDRMATAFEHDDAEAARALWLRGTWRAGNRRGGISLGISECGGGIIATDAFFVPLGRSSSSLRK